MILCHVHPPELCLRGLLDCFADAQIGPAPADIAGHGLIDIGIRRMRVRREECRCGHYLTRLTVAALRDFAVDPSFLNAGADRRVSDRLDRGDLCIADAVYGGDAGACGDAVEVYGASTTQRHAATKFRSGHAQHIAQHPKQWRVPVDIDTVRRPIDVDRESHGASPPPTSIIAAEANQLLVRSTIVSVKAWGASCGRLCPMPPLMIRCASGYVNRALPD